MSQRLQFNTEDRAALAALDTDFAISPGGEHASISGEMEITVERLADDAGNQFLLTITFPGGEQLEVRLRRSQLLEQLDVEADEGGTENMCP